MQYRYVSINFRFLSYLITMLIHQGTLQQPLCAECYMYVRNQGESAQYRYKFIFFLFPAPLAGAGDIETHRVRPSVRLSVRPSRLVCPGDISVTVHCRG